MVDGDRGLALRVLGAYERVADSSLLDRLVRGRLWIGLLAFALIGIVAMQLVVLKLNEGIGTTLAREAALQRANVQLGIEAATGSGEAQIAPLAAATGMTFAPSGSVHFVISSPAADAARAASVLAAPIAVHEASGAGEATTGSSSETASTPATVSEEAVAQRGSASSAAGEASSTRGVNSTQGAGSASSASGEGGSATAGSASAAGEASAAAAGSTSSGSSESGSTAAATPGASIQGASREAGATGGAEAGHG